MKALIFISSTAGRCCRTAPLLCFSVLCFVCCAPPSKPQPKEPATLSAADTLEQDGGPEEPDHWLSSRADLHNTGQSLSTSDAALGQVKWTWLAASRIAQTPVAAAGVLYLGDFACNFYALDAQSGKMLWCSRPRQLKLLKTELPKEGEDLLARIEPKDLDDHYGYSGPVIHEDLVIAATEYGVMTAFARTDGQIVWEHDFKAKVFSSLRVAAGKLLVGCLDGKFYAFNPRTGHQIWHYETGGELLGATPAIIGNQAVFPGQDRQLHFVNIETGKADLRIPCQGYSSGTPLFAFGCLYFCDDVRRFCCYDFITNELRWHRRSSSVASHGVAKFKNSVIVHIRRELQAWDGASGELIWHQKLNGGGALSPCVGPKYVYLTTAEAWVYAFDATTGEPKWLQRYGESNRASPILVNGLLYVSDLEGKLTAFE